MVPFTLHQLRLFVPVEINGREMLAHLDTGGIRTIVHPDVARDLPRVASTAPAPPHGGPRPESVTIDSLRFLEMEFGGVPATVDASDYLADLPFDAPVTLGAQILLSMPLILDFKRHLVGFADQPIRRELAMIPAEFVRGLTIIHFTLGGREIRGLIDTGSGYSVINAAHAPELGLRGDLAFEIDIDGEEPGQEEKMKVYRTHDLAVGELALGDCEHLLMDLTPVEESLGTRIDFIFGINSMITSGRVWVLNFAGRSVRVVRNGVEVMGDDANIVVG
jgi:predicted aspartyl protease